MADLDPNDGGDLHTGVNSPRIYSDEQATPESVKKELLANRKILQDLIPTAESVVAVINEERDSIKDIRSYLVKNIKEAKKIEIEFRARELYLSFLNQFESNIQDRLRTAKARQQPKKRMI